MKLPLSTELLLSELKSAEAILRKHIAALEAEGVPAVDQPGSEVMLEEFVGELSGELLLVAGKCENIARVLVGSD